MPPVTTNFMVKPLNKNEKAKKRIKFAHSLIWKRENKCLYAGELIWSGAACSKHLFKFYLSLFQKITLLYNAITNCALGSRFDNFNF